MTHHAYLYEGSMRDFEPLKERLKPFVAQKFERFGIEESRELVAMATLKRAGETVFLIGVSSITTEAQQALLKLLEEPQPGVSFVFLVPHGLLLPTVRSRMENKAFQGEPLERVVAQRFLGASGKTRSDMIAAMLKDDEGAKERARDFVNALEAELYVRPTRSNTEMREALADIAKVRDYLRDRSPSLKMLLEHLALSIPPQGGSSK